MAEDHLVQPPAQVRSTVRKPVLAITLTILRDKYFPFYGHSSIPLHMLLFEINYRKNGPVFIYFEVKKYRNSQQNWNYIFMIYAFIDMNLHSWACMYVPVLEHFYI